MDEPTFIDERAPKNAEPTLLFGKRYRAQGLLGTGGMGAVYLARDLQLDELVAIKVLRPELVGNAAMVERFRDEVRLARRVSSPFVARTHDLAEHEGRWFVTMQYIEGETLSAKLKREGALPLADIVAIGRGVCSGLAAVHEAGVVHRDLKPGNVIIARDGRAILTDFGIAVRADDARAHTDGYGTPTYTAPEQLAGEAVDARADVFSTGAMLYVLATGQRPFGAVRIPNEPAPDPRRVSGTLSAPFAAVVMRAMAPDPNDRWPSAEALLAALEGLRPQTVAAQEPALPRFVRALAAGLTRRVSVTTSCEGMTESFANAVKIDLVARLNTHGHLRASDDDPEAALVACFSVNDGRCLLTLTLTSTSDGFVFWTDTLEGPLATIPQLIERSANGVECAFAPSSQRRREGIAFSSSEVARLFLEGRAEYRAFWGSHLERSVALFEEASALAPDHPVILAWCAAARARHRFFESTPSEHDEARELALRAVALAPHLPEAHLALASAHVQQMRMVEAVPHFVEALRLAPGLLEHRSHFARILLECGAVEPSLALARSTTEVDPSYTEPFEVMIRAYALRGQMDRAAASIANARFESDAFVAVSFARYCTWNRDRAHFDAQVATLDLDNLDKQPRVVVEAYRAALTNRPIPFDALSTLAEGTPRRRGLFAQIRTELCAFVRDDRGAIDALSTGVDQGLFDIQWLDLCALLDPLRGTLRFEALRRVVHERAIAILTEVERCATSSA